MVDSLDSDSLYSHSIGRYIDHSWSPNVAVKARMIAGTPTVLLYGACYISPGTYVIIEYIDRRTSVPDWMRSTWRRRAPVPADETAGAGLASTVEGRVPMVTGAEPVYQGCLLQCTNLKLAADQEKMRKKRTGTARLHT